MEIFTEILKNISLILASISVVLGVGAWRREFIGRRRIELAEDVLALFYEAKDVVSLIRSPMGFSGEGQTRKSDPNESPEVKEMLDHAFSVIERYNKHVELFNKIRANRYRYMAQFGSESTKAFDELWGVIVDIQSSSHKLSRLWQRERKTRPEDRNFHKILDDVEKAERIFYEGGEDDPIRPRVDAAVEAIELKCQAVQQTDLSLWKKLKDKCL